jgi:hypothetical protein
MECDRGQHPGEEDDVSDGGLCFSIVCCNAHLLLFDTFKATSYSFRMLPVAWGLTLLAVSFCRGQLG